MKKNLLRAAPVLEAGIKDKVFIHLCGQKYLVKPQRTNIEGKNLLILNVYRKECLQEDIFTPYLRVFFDRTQFLTQIIDTNRWSVKRLDDLLDPYALTKGIAIRSKKKKKMIKGFFRCSKEKCSVLIIIKRQQNLMKEIQLRQRKEADFKKIDKLFRPVKAVTKTFEKWLEYDVLKSSQYIFYDYSRSKSITCTCSHCKSVYELENTIPRYNKEYVCPVCRRKAIFKARGKCGHIADEGSAAKIEKLNDAILIRHFQVRKYYSKPYLENYEFEYWEDYRVVFRDDTEYYRYQYSYEMNKHIWHRKRFDKYFDYRYHLAAVELEYLLLTRMNAILYTRNLEKALKGTPFQYCALKQFASHYKDTEIPINYYLKTYIKFPRMEYLVKQKMYHLTNDIIFQIPYQMVTSQGKNMCDLLKISKDKCEILAKYDWGLEELRMLQEMEKLKISWTEEEIKSYSLIYNCSTDLLELNKYAPVKKIIKYIAKEVSHMEGFKGYCLGSNTANITEEEKLKHQNMIRSWGDYIKWAEKLKYYLKSEYVLFPKNFIAVHDKTHNEYEKCQEKIQREKLKKQRKKVNYILKEEQSILKGKIKDDRYILIVPKDWQDIRKEGQILGHCVGDYIKYIADRKCDVYFIRKVENPETPFYTVDWRDGKIVQCQGKGRCAYPNEMAGFIKYAEQMIGELKEKELLKIAA